MNRPPSIRDIARRSGFSKSTVAAALANSPVVTARTRETIVKVAERLGYRRDPVVADLAARRWRSRAGAAPPVLAYVYDYGQDRDRVEPPLAPLQAAAAAHGYLLEALDLGTFKSDAQASRVLYHRAYRGLLVGRILRHARPPELEWDRFTAVACDVGFVRPPLHTVIKDHFACAYQATRTAIERGYRRPGCVVLVHNEQEEPDSARLGGYLAACNALPIRNRLPVHVGSYFDNAGLPFRAWYRRVRPDVVVGLNDLVEWWLRNMGVSVPAETGFVTLSHAASATVNTSGIDSLLDPIYHAAVELLVGQIHINARGVPALPRTVLIPPVWHEGDTLPPVAQASARPASP